jgi:hypothetical protein
MGAGAPRLLDGARPWQRGLRAVFLTHQPRERLGQAGNFCGGQADDLYHRLETRIEVLRRFPESAPVSALIINEKAKSDDSVSWLTAEVRWS